MFVYSPFYHTNKCIANIFLFMVMQRTCSTKLVDQLANPCVQRWPQVANSLFHSSTFGCQTEHKHVDSCPLNGSPNTNRPVFLFFLFSLQLCVCVPVRVRLCVQFSDTRHVSDNPIPWKAGFLLWNKITEIIFLIPRYRLPSLLASVQHWREIIDKEVQAWLLRLSLRLHR